MKLFSLPAFLAGLISFTGAAATETLVEAKVAMQSEVQSGFTRAHSRVMLSAEQAGRIATVNGDVGDSIGETEPFACLDDTYLNLELRSNQTERDLLTVDIDYYDKEVVRYQSLAKSNSSSQSQLDSAVRNLRRSRAQLRTLVIEGEVLEERKQRLCIKAPAGWRVIKRYVEPGKWVNAGESVVEVGDYRRLSATFALSTQEFQALTTQLPSGLKVRLPELGLELPAQMIRVSPAFNDQSRKIHLELVLSEGLTEHRGGLRVDLPLNIPSRAGAVLVPQEALKQRYEQYWLKRPDGTEIDVVYLGRSGPEEGGWVRVVSPDIHPGDQFLTQDD